MKTAVLVVDVQSFFVKRAPIDFVINLVDYLKTAHYDLVAFSVFKNEADSNFSKSLLWNKCLLERDCTLAQAFEPYIKDSNIFYRTAYSAFKNPHLNEYFHKNAVEKVVICGIDTDACVLATAFSAFDNGYVVHVESSHTFSTGGLDSAARAIIGRNLEVRRA